MMRTAQRWWKPVWSVPAAMRAVRGTVVVPGLFALTGRVVGDPQMALFATFGAFATVIIANFGGARKDKFITHLALAVVGSLALIIGTLVSGTTWLAAVVTIPVTFAIFFAGVAGPDAVSGSTAAMFAYVLPVASAGGAATIPSRLEGWLLASAAGTAAVLLLSPRTPGDRLRAAATELAGVLADRVKAAANGEATRPEMMRAAEAKLATAFTAAPYRPTGLAIADQALTSVVQLLEWGTSQIGDAFDGHVNMTQAASSDRDLLCAAGAMLADIQALLAGLAADPDFAGLEEARAKCAAHMRDLSGRSGEPDARIAAANAVHSQAIAVVARSAASDALIVARRADPDRIAAARRQWYGQTPVGSATAVIVPAAGAGSGGTAQGTAATIRDGAGAGRSITAPAIPNRQSRLSSLSAAPRLVDLAGATAVVTRHATIRSVWFLNSVRASLALAAAVAVADLSTVQHGFWVVLGTLSVLRTSAASTGGTAWRALAGTVVGFAVGALLLLAIGTGQTSLWVAPPVAVAVAAYAPGMTPFLVGQAAFTVTIVVLYNLLVPVGWKVGLLRVEDVAIGCGVSLVVGVLFWPRGASSVVWDDIADAFRRGAEYLTQAVDWALSEPTLPPAAAEPAVSAGIRLDDAVRGFLAENGSKRISKEDLLVLVNASTRLRLTAHTLAALREAVTAGITEGPACLPLAGSEEYADKPACVALRSTAAVLAGFYRHVADEVGRPGRSGNLEPVPAPPTMPATVPRHTASASTDGTGAGEGSALAVGGAPVDGVAADNRAAPARNLLHPHLLWVQEHLHHLSRSAQMVSAPALRVAEVRRRPWWR